MYNDPNRGAQGASPPERTPIATHMRLNGYILRMPVGASVHELHAFAPRLPGPARRAMDADAGPQIWIVHARGAEEHPADFDNHMLHWLIRRADRRALWTWAQHEDAAKFIEADMLSSSRMTLIVAGKKHQNVWMDTLDKHAGRGQNFRTIVDAGGAVGKGMLAPMENWSRKGGVK